MGKSSNKKKRKREDVEGNSTLISNEMIKIEMKGEGEEGEIFEKEEINPLLGSLSFSIPDSDLKFLIPSMITSLILWCLSDKAPCPSWISIVDKILINKLVLVIVEDFKIDYMPNMSHLSTFTQLPINVKESKHLLMYLKEEETKSTASFKPCNFSDVALSKKMLSENKFPKDVPDYKKVTDVGSKAKYNILGIDCEMVETGEGKVLSRITVVNEEYNVELDMLIKPKGKVTNYLTEYSGMTKEILNEATSSLDDAQKALFNLMSPKTYLVGHSLENDLIALKIMHDKIIDTSICFPNPNKKYKYSLKHLSKQFLGLDIQNGETGHCSIEDATAALKLVQLKLKNGIHFGLPVKKHWISLLEILSSVPNLKCAVVDDAMTLKIHSKSAANFIAGTVDVDREAKVLRAIKLAKFIATRFVALESATESKPEVIKLVAGDIDQRISRIHSSLPIDSLLMVVGVSKEISSFFISKR